MMFGLQIKQYKNWSVLLCDIKQKLDKKEQFQIITVNPEMMVQASKDKEFLDILRKNFLLADGIGISIASKILDGVWLKRYPGVDLMQQILKNDLFENYSFYFFGASQKSVENLIKKINNEYLHIKIAGYHTGEIKEFLKAHLRKDYKTSAIIEKINNSKADILFVALGSPLQEKWINFNSEKFKFVKLMIGIGGAFDMISGITPRAPLFLRQIGLEWLWRFMLQPKRFRRIFNAVVIFSLMVLKQKLTSKWNNFKD